MGKFNSGDHYIYYCKQESLRRDGVALRVNKRVQNAVLRCNLKNNRLISACLEGKPFSITLIQVYAPTANAEVVEQLYGRHTRPYRTNTKKENPFHHSVL